MYYVTDIKARRELKNRGWKGLAWWRHQMETYSALLALCAGNSPVTGEFPAERTVTRTFDVFFELRLTKRLSKNSRESGDLKRHRAHFDVTVMGWKPQVFFAAGSSDHTHYAGCMHPLFIHYFDLIGFRYFIKWPTSIRTHTNIHESFNSVYWGPSLLFVWKINWLGE